MYEAFRDRAAFNVVYIAEAHAEDGWQTTSNRQEGVVIKQHTTIGERRAAAHRCARELAITIPMLIDGMDDAACKAFSAWPERIYIIDREGTIAYQGGHGPYDFHPEEARAALESMLPAGH
jgi:iodothyronine deiodinase-like protein